MAKKIGLINNLESLILIAALLILSLYAYDLAGNIGTTYEPQPNYENDINMNTMKVIVGENYVENQDREETIKIQDYVTRKEEIIQECIDIRTDGWVRTIDKTVYRGYVEEFDYWLKQEIEQELEEEGEVCGIQLEELEFETPDFVSSDSPPTYARYYEEEPECKGCEYETSNSDKEYFEYLQRISRQENS